MKTKKVLIVFLSVISILVVVSYSSAGQLVYSTYIGGSSDDVLRDIAIDPAGNVYVTGWTNSSTDFPTTSGAFDTIYSGGVAKAFVSKLSNDGTSLIYSTLIGGNGDDEGLRIAVDNSGNAYVAMIASSSNFPVTPGAFDTTHLGYAVIKLNATGSSLIYSTFLNQGFSNGIAVDTSGNVYITGESFSADFPTTPGAFDTVFNSSGRIKGFVTKLNPLGSALIYSTLIGGTDDNEAKDIDIDNNGNAYITGDTYSTDFPTTPGAFDTTFNAPGSFTSDIFVCKLNPLGSALVYSTFLGGKSDDRYPHLKIDTAENAYITGYTQSTDFPTTLDAFNTKSNGYYDVFISKLNTTGSVLLHSTYLGGNDYDTVPDIVLDEDDNVYIAGHTYSHNFPVTANAYNTTYREAFISKFNPSLSKLLYSTYFGGVAGQYINAIAQDTAGHIIVAGWTISTDFPTTFGAFDTTFNGGPSDIFVSKFLLPLPTSVEPELWELYDEQVYKP